MSDLDLDAIEARAKVASAGRLNWQGIDALRSLVESDVPALVALVRAKESWIDGAKVDMAALEEAAAKATTWHMEALDDLAACVADRDEARAGWAADYAVQDDRIGELQAERDEARAEVAAIRDRADRLEEEGFWVGGVWGDYGEVVVPTHAVEWVVSGLDEAVTPETDPNMAATWRDRVAATESERDDWRRRYEALRDGVTGLFPEGNDRGWGDGAVTIRNADCREVVHAVVARVEGDES